MILTKDEILLEIKKKRIALHPFDPKAVGPASVDLTLDRKIRVFRPKNIAFSIDKHIDYKKITIIVDITKGYILEPGELVLGITKEKIVLPDDICGWLNSRSSFARIGLMSHVTAPFVSPGVANRQVLEIFNAGPEKIRLVPGARICQLILQQCRGKARYEGKFKSQKL
ncbi:MAG: dCTP deaminase [Elusimicrobia bacterium]|nr:dCTP deaminase [Elusimicrobiota bacterium]